MNDERRASPDPTPRHFFWLTCGLAAVGTPIFHAGLDRESDLTLVGGCIMLFAGLTGLVAFALSVGVLFKPATKPVKEEPFKPAK